MSVLKDIVIVGNGSIGVDNDGAGYINKHTGKLLNILIAEGIKLTYVELVTKYDKHFQNFCLQEHAINSFEFHSHSKLAIIKSVIHFIICLGGKDFFYIFYPGTLGRLIALFCLTARRKYGLYVRGEKYKQNWLDLIILRNSCFILTISPSLEKDLKNYNPSVQTIKPMNDLTPNDVFKRCRLTNPPDCWNLLYVGAIQEDKGINELMEMTRLLKTKGINFKLRIVGGGELFASILHDKQTGIWGEEIEPVGLITNKHELMQEYEKAHIFVFPSHHEGFPRVLYEAMIKSLPILTTFVGGISGRMHDGVNCIQIPVKDSAALVLIIEQLMNDLSMMKHIGDNGLLTVLNVLENEKPQSELLLGYLAANA